MAPRPALAARARPLHHYRAPDPTGCAEAWIQTRYGKLPVILLTSPRPYGERAYVWCPAGVSQEDFEEARDILCSACWATNIEVSSSDRYSHIVILDLFRYRGTE
jgi:hypothetical protein